jgi:hypothetical protein
MSTFFIKFLFRDKGAFMQHESKLVLAMREAIDVIKMVFFQKIRSHLRKKYQDRDAQFINTLAGAIINQVFGSPNPDERFVAFVEQNTFFIQQEMKNISVELQEMRIPLTDALRIQFICDYQEGIDSTHVLEQAKELGILIEDRQAPLPAQFLTLARKLGSSLNILVQE